MSTGPWCENLIYITEEEKQQIASVLQCEIKDLAIKCDYDKCDHLTVSINKTPTQEEIYEEAVKSKTTNDDYIDHYNRGHEKKLYYRTLDWHLENSKKWIEAYRIIARWSLQILPNSPLLISLRAEVHSDFRRKGLGLLCNKIRQRQTKDSGGEGLLCTVASYNHAQIALLTKAGWERHSTYRNGCQLWGIAV